MISRFNREGAVTVSDVLNSAPPLNDELPNLDCGFVKRDTTNRLFTNPLQLTSPLNQLALHLYWLEFLGDGDRARADENFLAQKLKNMQCRLNSNWEKRILAQFDYEWNKRSAINAEITNPYYIVWMNDIRKQANDYWKDAYNSCYTRHNELTVPGRYERIKELKRIYKENWKDYIWRILDIDDIGMFFDEYNPVYKKHEDDKLKKIKRRYEYK